MRSLRATGAICALTAYAASRQSGQSRRLRRLQRQQRQSLSGFLKRQQGSTLVKAPAVEPPRSVGLAEVPGLDARDLVTQLPLTLRELVPTSVVDCGSGSTRAIHFSDLCSAEECGPILMSRCKSEWRGDALASALQDEAKTEALLELLAEKIPEGPVLVGATAGVRYALEMGLVEQPQLENFGARLRGGLGSRARFAVLSGQDEARAEWEATRYELSIRDGLVDPVPASCMGMLSGGGMSCQLVLKDKHSEAPEALLSFWNRVLEPGGLVESAAQGNLAVEELIAELHAHEALASDAVRNVQKQHEGTFALVEWVGLYVGGTRTKRDIAMGLGYEKNLGQPEVLEALDRHLKEMIHECGQGPVPRPNAVALVYGTVIRTIISQVFGEGVNFYCLEGVGWATGHYLLSGNLVH